LLSNEIAHISLRLDSGTSAVTSAARGWSNHASGDEVSEAIIGCVEWRELGNRATPVRHDHFFTGLDAIDVLAETILQVADPDLRPRSSYVHTISVATSIALSTGYSSLRQGLEPTHINIIQKQRRPSRSAPMIAGRALIIATPNRSDRLLKVDP
jgi:hypothetical protein